MRIDSFPRWWLNQKVTSTPSEKTWCGIAIGPGSAEGLAIVEGFPLQAGRVLPLRSSRYTIEHARPTNLQLLVADELVRDTSLDCIDSLEVILFEDPAEMGSHVQRAIYSSAVRNFVANANPAVVTLALSAPFVGRRQAKIMFHSDDLVGTFGYLVKGVSYSPAGREIVRYDGPGAAAQTLDANGTYAIYVGGMDNAELWDALEVYVYDADGHIDIDVDSIGELGAY